MNKKYKKIHLILLVLVVIKIVQSFNYIWHGISLF